MKRIVFHFVLIAIVVALVPNSAHSQQPNASDMATRRDLLGQAQAESTGGRHAHALELALRAAEILRTASLTAFIAWEQEQLNQVADALGNAQSCIHDVSEHPDMQDGARIRQLCQTVIRDMGPRAGHVTVRVGNHSDGLRISVGGHTLNPAFYGVPYTVTPGNIEITAVEPGHNDFRQTVAVGAAATVELVVQLADSPRSPEAPVPNTVARASVSPSPQPTQPIQPATQPETPRERNAPSLAAPGIVAAIGAAGLIAGGVFWAVLRANALGSATGYCLPAGSDGEYHCQDSTAAMSTFGAVDTWTYAADTAFAVGAAALILGAAWLITGITGTHHTREHAGIGYAIPTYASGSLGVSFGGSF